MRKRTGRERFGGAAIGTDLNYEGITTFPVIVAIRVMKEEEK